MTPKRHAFWPAVLALAVALPLTPGPGPAAADDDKYVRVTIRGRLIDPDTDLPMGGAVVRFISTGEEGRKEIGITDAEGAFAVHGLGYGSYVMEIETAAGEHIRGVNALNVQDKPVEVILKVSSRFKSATSVDSRPDRFFAVVEKKGTKWGRFWREFAGFFGVAVSAGAAVL